MSYPVEPLADPIPEACRRLGMSKSTLYLELKAGAIKALKIRGKSIITRAEQERYLTSLPNSHF